MSQGSLTFAFMAALATSLAAGGCSAGSEPAGSSTSGAHTLYYRQEGGLGRPRPSLTVAGSQVSLTLGACSTNFTLRSEARKRLQAALDDADIPALAGNYPPAKGSADAITYVLRSDGHEVRIAPAPLPENERVWARLRPLLSALARAAVEGERRLSPSCLGGNAPHPPPEGDPA